MLRIALCPLLGFAQKFRFGLIYCEFNALNLAVLFSILTFYAKPPCLFGWWPLLACRSGALTWCR
jgi:hypothetical protein